MLVGFDMVDVFVVLVVFFGSFVILDLLESFVLLMMGMVFVYNRNFLDLMFDCGVIV